MNFHQNIAFIVDILLLYGTEKFKTKHILSIKNPYTLQKQFDIS